MGFYERRREAIKSGKVKPGHNRENREEQPASTREAYGPVFRPGSHGLVEKVNHDDLSFLDRRRQLYAPSLSKKKTPTESEYISKKKRHSGSGMSFGDGGGSGALRRMGEQNSSGGTVRAWDAIERNKATAGEYISRSAADRNNPLNIATRELDAFKSGRYRIDKTAETDPVKAATGGHGSSAYVSERLIYDKMTEGEKTAYNYIYGKKGVEAAEAYKESIRDSIEGRIAEEAYKGGLGNRGKLSGSIPARVASSFGSGIGSAFTGLVDLGRGIAGYEDPRRKAYFERAQELLRSDQENSKVENVSHDIANAIGYMMPSVAVSAAAAPAVGATAAGHVGQSLFGLSAAGRGYDEGLRAGGTVNQARLFGLQQGVDEYITGRLLNGVSAYGGGFLRKAISNSAVANAMKQGIDRFVKSPGANAVVKNIVSAAGDMASEAAQEFLQNYTEKVSRNLILGEKNKISLKDPDAWYAAFLGAATAGVMNAPGQVVNTVNMRREGRDIDTAEIVEMADAFEDDPEKYSDIEGYKKVVKAKQAIQAIAGKSVAGIEVSDLEKGAALDLVYEAVDYNRENMIDGREETSDSPRVASQNDREYMSMDEGEHLPIGKKNDDKSDPVTSPDEDIEEIARRNQIRVAPIEERAKQFAKNGKKAYLENYRKNSSVPLITYDEGFKVSYNVGRYGGRLTEVRHPAFHMLNVDQQNAAYQAGVMDLHHARKSQQRRLVSGDKNVGGLVSSSKFAAEANKVFADHVGKKTGLSIEIVDNLPFDANGAYIAKKGIIQIAYNAENFNAAMSHELSHFIKDYSPEKYEVFQSESVQALANSQGLDFEGLISEYQARYEESGTAPTREEIIDEITNDSIAHVLNDKKFVDRIAKRDKTLSQKIVDFLSDVIEAIDKLISTVKGNKAADALRANRQAYKKAADLWFEALETASERRKSGAVVLQDGGGDSVFSIRNDRDGRPVEAQNNEQGKMFSLRLNNDVDIKKLQRDNERLRGVNEGLRKQFKLTKGYEPNQKEVRKLARDILSEVGSKYPLNDLSENLTKVFKYINENGEAYSDAVIKVASSLSRDVLEEVKELTEDEAYREIRNRLKQRTIKLSDSDISELKQFDGYGAVRRKYFGAIKFSRSEGLGIDQIYAELSEEFPWAFDSDIVNPANQLEIIMDVVDASKAVYTNPYSSDMDEVAYLMAQDIFQKYFEIGREAPTFADRKKAQLDKLKADHKKALTELKNDLKAKNAEKIAKLKERHRQLKERQAERNRIRKTADDLLKQARMLSKLKGSEEFLREKQALIGDLDLTSKSMSDKTRLNLESLLVEVEKMKASDRDFITSRDIEAKLARLNKRQISSLTVDEMIDLTQAIVELRHAQQTANKMLGMESRKTVSELGQQFISEMDNVKGTNVSSSSYAKDRYILSMLDPIRAFKKMTGWQEGAVLVRLGEDLDKGQLKKSDFEMKANKLFNPHMEDRNFTRGLKKQSIKIFDAYGNQALISPAMRISLYLHSLNNDNMRHMGYGGVIIPNAKLYNRGRLAESYGQGSSKIILKRTQVEEIISQMTDAEKEFAETAKYFFNEMTKEAINSTSLALDGYSKAVVDDYFPIKTDRDFNRIDVSGLIKDGTIEGMGMLKERVGSMNPILLEDVTNVITRQIENTAMYYGLAIPVRNFNKVYNFGLKAHENSVRRAITQKWGLQGKEYIEKTLRDIQGARPQISVFGKYRNHFAGAVLTANISVTLKQFASFPTAAAELDWGSVAKSLTPLAGKVDRDLVDKYTPLLWLRSQGDTNPEFGYISKQAPNFDHRGIAAKVKKMFNWIQAMDTFTVGRVWKASEFYVSKHYPYMEKGSDRYYRKVAEIFNNAVEKTQPNYSVMQRPQALRNESELVRSLTMFMTQRLQNFGILEDARGELVARQKEHNLHGSAKTLKALRRAEARFNRAVASQIVSASMVSAMTIIAKLALYKPKDYKDDDGEISPEKMLQQFLLGVVSSTAGNVIGGSELFNAVYGVATGKKPYEIKVPAIELLSNVYEDSTSFAIELTAAFSGEKPLEEKSTRLKNAAKSLAYSVASVRGVPVKSAEQLINAIILHTKDMIHGEFGSFKGADNKEKKSGADEVFITMYEKGDYDTFIKEYNRAVIRSKDKEKIDRELQRRLAATDEVKQIAEAIANGDEKQAEKIRKDLEDKGFKGKLAPLLENAVQSAMRVRSKGVDGAEKSNIPKDFDISNTDETITESKNEKLVSWMEKGGDLEDFLIFDQAVKAVKADMDKNGAAIPGSKKSKVIGIIDGMDIPEDLKDHLFISQGYSAKSLVDAPWNSVEGAPTKEDLLKDDLPKWMQEDSSYLQNAGFSKDRADKWAQDIGNIKNIVNNSGEVVTKRQDQVAQYINNLPVSYVDKDKIWLIYYSDRNLPDWSN